MEKENGVTNKKTKKIFNYMKHLIGLAFSQKQGGIHGFTGERVPFEMELPSLQRSPW